MSGFFGRVGKRLRLDLLAPPSDQFQALNGMRGLSAYLVVCFHIAIFSGNFPLVGVAKPDLSWFHRSINGFWVGLDVFFVLSGFLIGRILMLSLQRTGTVEFWSFFTRRSIRIFPAYYLILTLAIFWYLRLNVGYMWFFAAGGTWEDILHNSWQNYAYVVNYFFQSGAANPMAWSWSLCVEEQFYLILPLVLTLIYRSKRPGLRPALLWFLMLLPVGIRTIEYIHNPDIVLLDGFYYRTHNRLDEVFYGVLVAYYYVHHYDAFKRVVQRLGSATWIIGLLLIALVWTFGGLQEQGAFAVIVQFNLMALGPAFLMVNGLFLDNRATRFFAHPFWFPVARVSYGIYLTHTYVLFFILKRIGLTNATTLGSWQFIAFFALVMLATTFVAAVMFVSFERPLIDYGRVLSRRFRKPSIASPPESVEGAS